MFEFLLCNITIILFFFPTFLLFLFKKWLLELLQRLLRINVFCSFNSSQTALYEAGKDAMEKEFRNLLTRHGKPVSAIALLDAMAMEEGR